MMEERCPGCGLVLPVSDGPTHAYVITSPSCWDRFSRSLANVGYRLYTDAYMAQHPGGTERRQLQSVAVHLVTLYAVLKEGRSEAEASKISQEAVGHGRELGGFPKLAAPVSGMWPHTIVDVLEDRVSATEYAISVLDEWLKTQEAAISEWTSAVITRL